MWLALIKLILFFIPLGCVISWYYKRGENPLDLLEFMREGLGEKVTNLIVVVFVILLVYFGATEYLLEII